MSAARQPTARTLCWLFFLALLAAAASAAAAPPIRAVATTSVFADFVAQVGGERVEVYALVPAGADPHTFEPTPKEARQLATADLLFMNGLGYEAWLAKFLQSAGGPGLRIVTLSEGLVPLPGATFTPDDGHGHGPGGDPHFWLDVRYAMHYVRRIEEALTGADPEGADYYRARAAAYIAELEALDRWFAEQIAQIPPENRVVLTYHSAFAYMAARYGLTLHGVVVQNPDREPSSRELAALIQDVRRLGIKAIFAEPQINPRFAQTLAAETGIRVATLYSDALSDAVPTYVDMMRHNAHALVEALR